MNSSGPVKYKDINPRVNLGQRSSDRTLCRRAVSDTLPIALEILRATTCTELERFMDIFYRNPHCAVPVPVQVP